MNSAGLCKSLFLLPVLWLGGCAQTISWHEGKRLSEREVATLEYSFVTHVKLDQKPVGEKPGLFTQQVRLELAPKEYAIEWTELNANFTFPFYGCGVLKARAGEHYVIKRNWLPGATHISGADSAGRYTETQVAQAATWIENAETGEVVAGIKPPWADRPAKRDDLQVAR